MENVRVAILAKHFLIEHHLKMGVRPDDAASASKKFIFKCLSYMLRE
jgi:hypothetical protein